MKKFLKSHGWLLLIILAAVFFRFWQISHLPGGLFPDEAANGLDVNSILKGHLAPFYERGNGREALFFYLLALSVRLFGRGVWQLHIVNAGVGVLEILVAYLLTKEMFGKKIALLAAFFMATSSYAVSLNRDVFRANLIPLFTTLTIYFTAKFFKTQFPGKKIYWAIAAGCSLGLGFYTYIAYRMMLPFLVLMLAIWLIAVRHKLKEVWRAYYKYALWFTGAFVIAVSWIANYFIRHPSAFVGRASEVSIFSKDLNHGNVVLTLLQVFKTTLLGFFTQGDLNWRQNVSGFPFLSPFLSGFFAIALLVFTVEMIILLKNSWQKKIDEQNVYKAATGLWFWLFLAPEITTAEGIPHGLRLIGVIPPIFIMSAWGLNKLFDWIKNYIPSRDLKLAFAATFILLVFLYNFLAFFGVSANSPDYAYAYRTDLTAVSNYLNARALPKQTYLSLDDYSVQTVQFLTTDTDNPYTLVDPAHSYEIPWRKNDQIIFTQSTIFDHLKFLKYHPEAKLVRETKNQFNELTMLVYQKP